MNAMGMHETYYFTNILMAFNMGKLIVLAPLMLKSSFLSSSLFHHHNALLYRFLSIFIAIEGCSNHFFAFFLLYTKGRSYLTDYFLLFFFCLKHDLFVKLILTIENCIFVKIWMCEHWRIDWYVNIIDM